MFTCQLQVLAQQFCHLAKSAFDNPSKDRVITTLIAIASPGKCSVLLFLFNFSSFLINSFFTALKFNFGVLGVVGRLWELDAKSLSLPPIS